LAGRNGYGHPLKAVDYEVQVARSVHLDRRDRLTVALRQRQVLPAGPHRLEPVDGSPARRPSVTGCGEASG